MASELCIKYDSLLEGHPERKRLLIEIFPEADDSVFMRGLVYVDYDLFTKNGKKTHILISIWSF